MPWQSNNCLRMRRPLLIALVLTAVTSFGQEWIDYKVDSTLTISIPDNFKVADTLGGKLITARVDYAAIGINVLPNKGTFAINIADETELIETYKTFRKGFVNSQKGQLIKEELIEKNGLKFWRFSFRATQGDEKHVRHSLVIFVNEYTYAITFSEFEDMAIEMTPVREQLFSSVKLRPSLTIKNQMSDVLEGSRSYRIGY